MTREELKSKRIGVLMGGVSREREISLRTGSGVCESLLKSGMDVVPIDCGRDLVDKLSREKIDVAFNALHGTFGEDGGVQGLLELIGIPYTGTRLIPSALTFDKILTKKIAIYHGIVTPKFLEVKIEWQDADLADRVFKSVGIPCVVKPSKEGSSIGVFIVRDRAELTDAIAQARAVSQELIVEEYIDGTETTVAVLDGRGLPPIEIVPVSGFYDLKNKYTSGATNYLIPTRLGLAQESVLIDLGEKVADTMNLSGACRSDFIISKKDGVPYFLEVNTVPGMTPTSLLPKAAAARGITYDELVLAILSSAR